MDTTERPRSIRLPQWLWDEIDRDGIRCRRSSVKQLEVVLTAYYRGDKTGLNTKRLDELTSKNGIEATEITLSKPKQKAKTGS